MSDVRIRFLFLASSIVLCAAPLFAADFEVTTTADSGAGSLRQALIDADGDGGPSTITFAPALNGQTITPLSTLPGLNENGTTIDGDSNDDCVPDVLIDGQVAVGSGADGLYLPGDGHNVRGLAIVRFQQGIRVQGDASTINCNYIGTNLAQQAGFGNLQNGVLVQGSDNTIGPGNVISSNSQAGVQVEDGGLPGYPEFTALTPDFVGVFPQVAFDSPNEVFQTVGGGIVPLDGSGRPFTDQFGMRLRGELSVSSAGNYTFTFGPLDDNARLTVDATVVVDGSGPGPLSGNLSLGAGTHTIRVDFQEGGGFAGMTLAINGPGSASLSTNAQALCATGQPGLCGELFRLRDAHERNRITQNRITDNGGLGIRLRCCGGPLGNDSGDLDLGANTWLNHPVLSGLVSAGSGNYTLSGTGPANATIEVFIAVVDPSGHGEAGSLLTTLASNGSGNFSGTLSLPAQPSVLSATATDAAGNTSEFGPNLAYGAGADVVTLGSGFSAVAGTSVAIPIRVRDLAFTPLGVDRPTGERIQGLALRVNFPAGAFTSGSIVPAGITAGLTPLFGPSSSFAAGSVNYLVSYDEASNLIPFMLDVAAPGNQVATLNLTVAADHPGGSVPLSFDAVTELSNQAGTLAENPGNGALQTLGTSLSVSSNAPRGLYARAQSTNSVKLQWIDPDLGESGFRVERSTDGNAYTTVQDVGPNAIDFLDTGRSAGTLYYYRVRSLFGAVPGGASNRATASTHPAVAANICVDPHVVSRLWARSPDAAFKGPEWGMVYHDRTDGTHEQVYFQRLDGTSLASLGARIQVSTTETSANFPAVAFNGSHYAVTWFELLRGAPGSFPQTELRFAQLDSTGQVLRQPRRIQAPPPSLGFQGFNEIVKPVWDGSHWVLLTPMVQTDYSRQVGFWRLAANGDHVLGPVAVTHVTDAFVNQAAPAWQPASSEFGVVWLHSKDATSELRFQRVEESTGQTLLASPAIVDVVSDASGMGASDLVAMPGGGWLAAWSACNDATGECLIYTRRIAADGTPDAGGRVQVSAGGAFDVRFRVAQRPGGFVVLAETFNPEELSRYHLDATGTPISGPTPVSAADGRRSGRPRIASDGTRALLLWSESNTTMEIAGRLSDGVSGVLDPTVVFTSGHDVANTAAIVIPGQPRIVAVGGGFASVWQEPVAGQNLLHGKLYAGNGSLVSTFAPLTPTAASGRPGLAAVGGSFAVAWRAPGNTLRFMRLAADGTVLVPETTLQSAVGSGTVELEWDGEQYAAVYNQGSNLRYVRISEGGVASAPVTLALGLTSGVSVMRLAWMGDGWALVLRRGDDTSLNFARFASDGSILLPLTVLTTPTAPPSFTAADIGLSYDGDSLALTWAESRALDPPGQDLYFTTLNRDGTKGFPEVALVASPSFDGPAQLHHAGGRFHLVYQSDGENLSGLRELDIDLVPGGAVIAGSRFLANRASAAIATAHDGAALTLAWRATPAQDIHIESDACLADATPPPCPSVSVSSLANNVRLAWPAVGDAESGIWRYHVYRDGGLTAELPASAVQFDDSGYDSNAQHNYSVRALNRAFRESQSCPQVAFSTRVGDANGNGALEVADIFYLINFLLSDGAAPLGDGDANGDGVVSVTDIFFLVNYFFGGGPLPTVVAAGSAS
jgi:hypothetical protein